MREFVSCVWLVLLVAGLGCGSGETPIPTAPDRRPSLGKNANPSIIAVKLPTLGGHADAYSINDAGIAVGSSVRASGPAYSFAVRWGQSSGTWSVTQIGGQSTRAAAINSSGTIVGDSVFVPVGNAVIWHSGGTSEVIGRGEANGVNDANVVVGIHYGGGVLSPAAWRQISGVWTVTVLDLPPGTVSSCSGEAFGAQATAISNTAIIAGFVYDQDCIRHYAVKWVPKANPAEGWEPPEILEGAAAMVRSHAYGIDGNTIVGEAWPCPALSGCSRRAYRWSLTPGSPDTGPIGSLDARANGLNSSGTAVGSYLDPQKMRAVMWNAGTSSHVTLPTVSSFNTHWVWDINNPIPTRSSRLAVGGATSDRGGMVPVVWTIP